MSNSMQITYSLCRCKLGLEELYYKCIIEEKEVQGTVNPSTHIYK